MNVCHLKARIGTAVPQRPCCLPRRRDEKEFKVERTRFRLEHRRLRKKKKHGISLEEELTTWKGPSSGDSTWRSTFVRQIRQQLTWSRNGQFEKQRNADRMETTAKRRNEEEVRCVLLNLADLPVRDRGNYNSPVPDE